MNSISIYIVEDELLISASIKSQLQNFGYEILGSTTRGETSLIEIEHFSKQGKEPEIVLMDIHLRGDLDGIETARQINEKFNCGIIFLTGQSSKEIYERSFKIKPFGYLLKPIDMEQTKMTIEIAAYQRNLELKNKDYQKNLEQLLTQRTREKNEILSLYQSIANSSLMGFMIIQDNKVIFVNNKTAEIFGYTDKEILSFSTTNILELIYPEDHQKINSLSQIFFDEKSPNKEIQIHISAKNGKKKTLRTTIVPVQYQGKPALHQSFIDITSLTINANP